MERLMAAATGGGGCLGIVGARFCPSEQELLAYYLYNKVRDTPTPMIENFVRECDLYGCQEPWEIWDLHQDSMMHDNNGDLYFFTQLKKKTNKSSRISRRVGFSSGVWAGEDAAKDIYFSYDGSAIKLGSKKRFRYENSDNLEQDGAWIMLEYKLDPTLCFPGMNDSYVLCRIRKNFASEITRNKKQKPKKKFEKVENGCGDGQNNSVSNNSKRLRFEVKSIDTLNIVEVNEQVIQQKVEEKPAAAALPISNHGGNYYDMPHTTILEQTNLDDDSEFILQVCAMFCVDDTPDL